MFFLSRQPMADYRVRLTLEGPIATPLHSGTLFGHLCWARHYLEGEIALEQWLEELPEQPLMISDAFPADHLPRPLLPPGDRPVPNAGEDRRAFTQRMQGQKDLRKGTWLAVADFLDLRDRLNEARMLERLQDSGNPDTGQVLKRRQAHNTIDRHTGTTPETGGLYFMDESWHDQKACQLDVYVQGNIEQAELQALFDQVGEFGFGRDASLGRGRFSARVEPANPHLFQHSGNRLLSLSHGILSTNMAAPRYKLHTHYGKLGGLYAGGMFSPFKYPLSLTRPGATFSPADAGPFGALLSNVHPHHSPIRHHAWHLCLPYTETSPKEIS